MTSLRARRGVTRLVGAVVAALLLGACGGSAGNGIVIGSLRMLGGPTVAGSGNGYLVAGHVVLRDASGNSTTIVVNKSGRFQVKMAPGTYHVTAGPATLHFRGCVTKKNNVLVVVNERVISLDVTCPIR